MTDRHDTALLERAGTPPDEPREPVPRQRDHHAANRIARFALARPDRFVIAVPEPVRADVADWQGASA